MRESLNGILKVQEVDVKLIRLVRVKKDRQKELGKLNALKESIKNQVTEKESQVMELKKEIRLGETNVKEILEKISRLEGQQAAVKKMDEFNALTQEITAAGRERNTIEQRTSDLVDRVNTEDDKLTALKKSLEETEQNSVALEKEIHDSIKAINEEGVALLKEREGLNHNINADLFKIYERLLKNKKDRVVVPIENRTCSGCHIVLTAQHENLVRKGDRLVFCEHCSRILYWQEAQPQVAEEEAAPRRRRRRAAVTA